MLERPALEDNEIAASLKMQYGLAPSEITFLPLGADQNTAVFRIDDDGHRIVLLSGRAGD